MTLYRGDTPLTRDEVIDYEIERELDRMCAEGLLFRVTTNGEPPQYVKTRKGRAELDGPRMD